ncbi:MAG: hypothetical protein ACR2NN_05200 [Bryobacteraceae bacterium]
MIAEIAFSLSLMFGCSILLLLLGTQILSPYWLAILFCASLAIGIYRSRGRLLSPYQLAQALDRRLNFNDSLSTAIYFDGRSGPGLPPREMILSQKELAEQQARSANLRAGLPFHTPKAVYAAVCLAVVAASIFAVRYGVTRSLDLRPALVHMPFTGSLSSDEIASVKKKPGQKTGRERSKETELSYDPWESKVMDQQGAPDSALNTVDTPEVNNNSSEGAASAKATGTPTQDPVQEPGESAEAGERSPSGKDQQSDGAPAPDKDGAGRSAKQSESQQDGQGPNSSGENSSLSDKMRDALANLMSKLKMNQKAGEGKQGASQSQNGTQSAKQQARDDKGSPMPGKPQSDGMSSPDAQGDQEGQSSDKAQAAQNKSAKGSDKPQSQDGKSGIGKQDGDKTAREAEQLAAMGKISELIGKRSANMTGEVMVEVASGKQQLKTQYSRKHAAHAEAGGEINRDEVPLAYQQYVQQYFEEIRKLPATNPKSKKPTGL